MIFSDFANSFGFVFIMSEICDIERRISRLEGIEAIRQLQARYQRCLDTRDFDGIADCFAEDVCSSYGNGSMSYEGRDAVMKFLCGVMRLNMPSTHLIHGGEVDIIDETHAHAKWYLEDYLLHQRYKMKLHGAAIYEVDYEKIDDKWVIKSIGYERCYEYLEWRPLMNLMTLGKRTFFDRLKRKDPETLGDYGKYFQYEVLKKKKL